MMVDGAQYIEVLERALVDLIRSELESGRTQTEVGDLLGIPQRTISAIVAGRQISIDTLKSGVGSEFFRQRTGTNPDTTATAEDRRWARIATRLRAMLSPADALMLVDALEDLATESARHEAILRLSGTPPPEPSGRRPETAGQG